LKHDKKWIDFITLECSENYRKQVFKNRILDLIDQSIKLLNTFHWKEHNKEAKFNIDFINSKEQIIDIQKYLLGLANMIGMTPQEYYQEFVNKSMVLDFRWKQDKIKLDGDVAVFDIDGVLADYNTTYETFLNDNGYVSKELTRNNYSYHIKYGITKEQEEKMNMRFIVEDGFMKILPFDGAQELLKLLKKKFKLKILLVTARPAWKFQNVIRDTYLWLNKYKLPYDKLVFNKDKADAVVGALNGSAKLKFAVEDRDKHAIEFYSLGTDVFLMDKEYNRNFNERKFSKGENQIHRIGDLYKLIKRFEDVGEI